MGNNPVTTAVDAITDNRTYYNCPRCNRRVYAYGSFVGNVCLKCPGTVLSAVGNSTSMVTFGATEPVATVISHIAPSATKLVTNVTLVDAATGRKAKHSAAKLVWSISKGSESNYGIDKSDTIRSIATRSVGIFSGVVTNSGVDHWWMLIETEYYWYNIQFSKDDSVIQIRRSSSNSDCNEAGLAEANRDSDVQPVHQNGYSSSNISGTIGTVTDWLVRGDFSSNYCLLTNNCQHLCKSLYRYLRN